jgi:hypothetical protein
MRTSWSLRDILLVIAVICFALAAILDVRVDLVAVGLAFGFASFLVGDRGVTLR